MDRWKDRWMDGWLDSRWMDRYMDGSVAGDRSAKKSLGYHIAGGTLVGHRSGLFRMGCGPLEAVDPSLAGMQSRMACPHTGWPGFGEGRVGGGGWCLLIPRTLWEAGCQSYFPWCGSLRGFSVKRQKDCMNISLGKQCVGQRTSGRTLQGAGSPCRK